VKPSLFRDVSNERLFVGSGLLKLDVELLYRPAKDPVIVLKERSLVNDCVAEAPL
jgi:hypothetical protein